MDLEAEAQRLRLDGLAVAVDRCLAAADIPHALIKGATTSLWLYDPPRSYWDVDVLVPVSRSEDAAGALHEAGLARGAASRAANEVSHSVELRTPQGFEVDLHASLPSLPVAGDAVWTALAAHLTRFDLGVGTVSALDEAGRCLVLAFHALAGGERLGQRVEDLRRARSVARPESWTAARAIAVGLGAEDLYDAALTRVGEHAEPLSVRAALAMSDAPPEAMALDRLLRAPLRSWPRTLVREVWPTAAFMRASYPRLVQRRGGLARARVTRWRLLAARLPAALRAYFGARS